MTETGSLLLGRPHPLAAVAAIYGLLVLSASVEARTPRFPDASVTRMESPSGHPYMVGGIGLAAQQVMMRAAGLYNLKLVFARRAGTLMMPTFLVIGNNHGLHLEKISVRGPWFYIRLPAGPYTILTRFDDQIVIIRNVYLGDEEQKTYWVRGE